MYWIVYTIKVDGSEFGVKLRLNKNIAQVKLAEENNERLWDTLPILLIRIKDEVVISFTPKKLIR